MELDEVVGVVGSDSVLVKPINLRSLFIRTISNGPPLAETDYVSQVAVISRGGSTC